MIQITKRKKNDDNNNKKKKKVYEKKVRNEREREIKKIFSMTSNELKLFTIFSYFND